MGPFYLKRRTQSVAECPAYSSHLTHISEIVGLFCFVLFCFVLFCFVLFFFVLFCFVLFCFVLFCFLRQDFSV